MDELLRQAIEITIEAEHGSTLLLQRKLIIGYNRADRLMEEMYKLGVVGELNYPKPRPLLIKYITDIFKKMSNQFEDIKIIYDYLKTITFDGFQFCNGESGEPCKTIIDSKKFTEATYQNFLSAKNDRGRRVQYNLLKEVYKNFKQQ